MSSNQKSSIFISYRRSDSQAWAGRIHDKLALHFESGAIYMDVASNEVGVDFFEVIENTLRSCNMLLAIIGTHWLDALDENGRRIDNPSDLVRHEISTALRRRIRILPVLVDGARMPNSIDLPEELTSLVRYNAFTIHHESFPADMERLIKSIQSAIKPAFSDIKASIVATSKVLDDLEVEWQQGMVDTGGYLRMKVLYEKEKVLLVDQLEKITADDKTIDLDPEQMLFNEILGELRRLRAEPGSHFESVLYRLNKKEQSEVQEMLSKVDSLKEASQYLEPIRDSLIELWPSVRTQLERDKEMIVCLQQVVAKLQSKDNDETSVSAKLKYSLPIIPAILQLEGELDFDGSNHLRKIFEKLAGNYNKLRNKLLGS